MRPRIFVVNLERRPERMARTAGILTSLGLTFERIVAVDGQALEVRPYFRSWLAWAYAGLSPTTSGAIGCFLSHRHIWQRIVDEKIDLALILEDDCLYDQWDPDFLDVDPAAYGLDILRIGAHADRRLKGFVNQMTKQPLQFAPETIAGRPVSYDQTPGTYAYLITRAGAEKMLACRKYWFSVDHYHIWRQYYGVKSAIVIPAPIAPQLDDSDTEDRERSRKSKLQIAIKRRLQRLLALNRTTTN